MIKRSLFGFSISLLAAAALANTASDFARDADYELAVISPQGTHLAVTQRRDGRETIIVLRLADSAPMSNTSFGKDTHVANIDWVTDSRMLIGPARRFPGFIDYHSNTGELFGLDANGKNFELLFGPYAGEMQTGSRIPKRQSTFAAAVMIDVMPDDAKRVMIQTYGYSYAGEYNAAYTMRVTDGHLRSVARSPFRNGNFVANHRHEVELVYGETAKGRRQTYHRVDGRWQLAFDQVEHDGWTRPVHAAADGFVVVDNSLTNLDTVYLWKPGSPLQLIYGHPDVDVSEADFDPDGKLWMLSADSHYPEHFYPDPEHPLALAHRRLRATFPDDNVVITGSTDDMGIVVAHVSGPRNPGVFHVMDIRSNKVTHSLTSRPWLTANMLGSVQPFEISARDGLKVRGYVTLPPGSTGKALPMIVVPHGGPHGVADTYGFDPEIQLLANQGYAVLQVNFRGSGGRGRDFLGAGYRRWGREMQDDITDAVRWTIAQGTADPDRICIFGASYGGYAALNGVVRDPKLYRCAVGYVGVYDLNLMFKRGEIQSVESGVGYLELAVGTDTAELERRSPVNNADQIEAAVLLVHGKMDERVPIEHAQRMHDALKRAGKRVEFVTERREAHGFRAPENRTELYERVLAFFATHLGKP